MALRFPQREPRDAKELFQWLRELLPDLEAKVIEDAVVETTETAIAHGLGAVPVFVHPDAPHCIAVVRQVKRADNKCVYLRATNRCVVNVLVVKSAQLARLTTSMRNGGFHLPDWDPGGGTDNDRLVAADETDTAPGTLVDKSLAGVGIAQSVVVDGGTRKLETRSRGMVAASSTDTTLNYLHSKIAAGPGINTDLIPSFDPGDQAVQISARFYQSEPRPDSTPGSPGDLTDETVAKGTHSHPATAPADPATYAGDLYTAVFADPLDHGTVKCLLQHGYAAFTGFEDASAEYGPYSYKKTTLAGVFGQPATESSTPITLYAGDRILLWAPVPWDDDPVHWWIYDVLDPGYHDGAPSTYAVIRRASDANSADTVNTGAFVRIQQGENAGKYAVITNSGAITLETTPIEITMFDDRTSAFTYPLVTQKQLTGSYEGNAQATALATASTPAYFAVLGPRYEMLFGTPMPTEVDAGDWQIQIACKVSSLTDASSGDAPADTIIRSEFGIVDMSGPPTYTELFTVDSEPIKFLDTEQVLSVSIPDQAGFSLGPNQYFYWTPQARTTSVGTIAVTILVSSPQHLTRIRTPLTFATTGGTNRHPELIDRDLVNQHPKRSVRDTIGTATVTGSGTTTRIAIPAGYRSAALTIADNLVVYGITLEDADVDDEVTLFVDGASLSAELTLVHLGLEDGTGIYAGLDEESGSGENKGFRRPVALVLKHRDTAGHWRLLSAAM